MKFTNLRDVLNYIENKTNFQLGLLRVEEFLKYACINYSKIKFIHIGGTNGKGSTSYYLSNVLIESGFKTGFFSSPSIETHNDRIRINNKFISDEDIISFVNRYYDLIEKTQVTMFEIDVLMALEYFVSNNVDYAVLEVGMGGRYDGTNIIKPIISIITNIGMDHLAYLGKDKLEIAYNKAGIIKEKTTIITAEEDASCLKVFENEAKSKNSRLIKTTKAKVLSDNPIIFDYKEYHNLKLKSLANYQVKNVALVLEAIDVLKGEYDVKILDETIKKVLSTVTWNGRFEIIIDNPKVIIDGAHNMEGVKELVKTLVKFKDRDITIVFAALNDKPTNEMVKLLSESCNKLVISEFDFYRSEKASVINNDFNFDVEKDYKSYLSRKINSMNENEMLVITGSLYFISEIRKFLLGNFDKIIKK